MERQKLNKRDLKTVDDAVSYFTENIPLVKNFANALMGYFQNDLKLAPHIHFIKYRIKDPAHLRAKLIRKALDGKPIEAAQLFKKITDLAGIRIIHLHTSQMHDIHRAILDILKEQRLTLFEQPTANCWDVEYENIFKKFGIATRPRDSMYTTVHYIVKANQKTKITCEIQVRTLMDEVWGEVSHRVNYPSASENLSCQDQLKVLARLTTGCTRLVDSIFRSHLGVGDPD